MKRILFVVGTLLVIVINSLVVLSLQNEKLPVPQWLTQWWPDAVPEPDWLPPVFEQTPPEKAPPDPIDVPAVAQSSFVKTLSVTKASKKYRESLANGSYPPARRATADHASQSGTAHSLGEVAVVDAVSSLPQELASTVGSCAKGRYGKEPEGNKVYRWVDDTGRIFLSDTPPPLSAKVEVKLMGEYPPQDYQLTLLGDTLTPSFERLLRARLDKVLAGFGRILDRRTIKRLDLTFRFFTQTEQYNAYREREAPTLISSIGFYQSDKHESVVRVDNVKQALETVAHEAVHATNRILFGRVARWLNEGLAQALSTSTPVVKPHNLTEDQLSLLLSATEADWLGPKRAWLYRHSHRLVSSWFSTQHGRESLARLLIAEQYNGCDTLTAAEVKTVIPESLLTPESVH